MNGCNFMWMADVAGVCVLLLKDVRVCYVQFALRNIGYDQLTKVA
jgi:hypothetical protein